MPDTKSKSNATLVIGAGELGMSMLRALTARGRMQDETFSVLLRPGAPERASVEQQSTLDALRDMNVPVVHADLAVDTEDDLAAVFSNFATVICCTGFVAGRGTQRKITSAVLKAGVDRYVPWQFGVDYDVVGRGSGQEVFDEQSDVRDMLRAQSRTHWVIVSTGMFTSFLFEPAFGVVDLQNARVHALGSWDHRVTVTTPADIGRLTVAILRQDPSINDRVVFVAGDTVTYRELADKVERHLGKPVERVLWTLATLRAEVDRHPDDGMRKYHLAFARSTGVAWNISSTFNVEQGLEVVDIMTWLQRHAPPGRGHGVG
jgi:hypothetical protein